MNYPSLFCNLRMKLILNGIMGPIWKMYKNCGVDTEIDDVDA